MVGFLTGAVAALVLSVTTYFVLENATITSIERIENASVNLDGVRNQYEPYDEGGTGR